MQEANQKYFSSTAGFVKVNKSKWTVYDVCTYDLQTFVCMKVYW